ncbi:hypothetical protein MNV49_007730 [Pseudohyphozyma bogoriensis]|nr:hypothetical protein MNV49_007730 [Pseudohyphozyma bogoriensis]
MAGSESDNSDIEVQVVKPEPSSSRRKSTAVAHDSSDDDEERARASKRVRKEQKPDVNGKGKGKRVIRSDDEDEDEDEEQQEGEDEESEDEGPRDLERDEDGYVAGSIVRVALENFVTYDKVEFAPGPSLNMVLGPNGTGKSTIACAIAIGLGFPIKVLGRSNRISEYVKTGHNEGWIEIELKGKIGKRNAVIRRYIHREDEKTSFTLNGKTATAKEISEKMKELNVQISNLCTFLPQDRVASFAQLSSPDLLKETQKAAGDRRLSNWQETLIKEHKNEKDLASKLEAVMDQLKRQKDKHTAQERDVQAFEQRRNLEHERDVLNLLIPYAEFNIARDKWNIAKEDRERLKNEVAELEAENKPFMDSKEALENAVKHYADGKKVLTTKLASNHKEVSKKDGAIKRSESDIAKVREQLEAITKDEKARKTKISNLSKDVERMERKLGDKPEEPDYTDIKKLLAENARERAEWSEKSNEFKAEAEGYEREVQALIKDEQKVTQQLKTLHDVKARRLQAVKDDDRDTLRAYLWVREQRKNGKFKGKVYEPPKISLNLKPFNGKTHTALAEAPISRAAFRTFLFEYREDYEYMMGELADKGIEDEFGKAKLRINGAQLGTWRTKADIRYRTTEEVRENWGFDCWAIDLVDGPEAVLAWLCEEHNLNAMPIALTNRPVISAEVEASQAISRYYTPDGSHSIKYSKYGKQSALVETRWLERPRHLSTGIDEAKQRELQQQASQFATRKAELKTEFQRCGASQDEALERYQAVDNERKKLVKERENMRDPVKSWLAAEVKLNGTRTALEAAKALPSGDARRAEKQNDMRGHSEKRLRLVLEYKDLVMKSSKLQLDLTTLQLRHLQAETDLRAMSSSADAKDQELNEKKTEYERLIAETSALHKKAKEVIKHAEDMVQEADEDIREEVGKRDKSTPLAELLQAQGDVSARLLSMNEISPEILRQYEKREADIAELEKKVEKGQADLDKSTALIAKVKAKWLPKLDRLVKRISAKFSEAFELLGLTGELNIAKDEDYDKWGIQIMVSFRDGEALQPLSAQRQSGGERALTTVMYLMALAGLAQAPFSLVDEINQGMDQRVERNVHNTLVKTTCKDDVGQYFLITPKLLPELEYHPKMKVLIVHKYAPSDKSLQV